MAREGRGGGRFVMTWQLDRLVRLSTVLLAVAVGSVIGTSYLVAATSEQDRVLGAMLIGALIIAIGGVVGSVVTASFGLLVFGFVCAIAEPGTPVMVVAGIAGFLALVLVDTSIVVRRGPFVARQIWIDTATWIATAVGVGGALFVLAWAIGSITTWHLVVTALGFAALGASLWVLGERHRARVRVASARRRDGG